MGLRTCLGSAARRLNSKACADIRSRGGKITREPGPMKHGSRVLAFVEDPDRYKIELLSPSHPD